MKRLRHKETTGRARDGEREGRMAAVLGGLRQVETGYFRLALVDAQRYDDVIGNFPV